MTKTHFRRHLAPIPLLLCAVVLSVPLAGCGTNDQKTPTADLIKAGWDNFSIGEFALASKKFALVDTRSDATPELKAQALYGRAMSESLGITENPAEIGINLFHQSIDAAPQSDWAAWSLMALARIKHHEAAKAEKDPDWEAVRKAYQEVIDRFPDSPAGVEALVMQQGTLLVTGKPDDAKRVIETVNAWMAAHPNTAKATCLNLLAECYNTLGDGPKEVAIRISSLEDQVAKSKEPVEKSGAYWSIATKSEFDCGDFPTARKYYRLLIDEYPSDFRIVGAKLALARMDKLETDLRAQLATQPSNPISTSTGGTP